jgi:hypothetical protein
MVNHMALTNPRLSSHGITSIKTFQFQVAQKFFYVNHILIVLLGGGRQFLLYTYKKGFDIATVHVTTG